MRSQLGMLRYQKLIHFPSVIGVCWFYVFVCLFFRLVRPCRDLSSRSWVMGYLWSSLPMCSVWRQTRLVTHFAMSAMWRRVNMQWLCLYLGCSNSQTKKPKIALKQLPSSSCCSSTIYSDKYFLIPDCRGVWKHLILLSMVRRHMARQKGLSLLCVWNRFREGLWIVRVTEVVLNRIVVSVQWVSVGAVQAL